MIQYIASDLDGTLLPDNGKDMDPRIFDIIRRFRSKDVHFIAASGRQYQSMRRLFAPIKDDISYISENGSLCKKDGKVICRGLIDRDLGLRILAAGDEYSRTYKECLNLISCESRHYTTSHNERYLNHMRNVIHNEIAVIEDYSKLKEPFLKLAFCDFEGVEHLASYMAERFSSEIKAATASAFWVDFIAPNANKGIALRTLLSTMGIDPKNGIAFGDQFNDVDMLKIAGTSYAMNTCAPGVEKYADHIIDDVPGVLEEILATL